LALLLRRLSLDDFIWQDWRSAHPNGFPVRVDRCTIVEKYLTNLRGGTDLAEQKARAIQGDDWKYYNSDFRSDEPTHMSD
jgi:hypothetical protein